MREPINYKHLRYFWAVAKEGSVTRAADKLGMSAQTVSGQISRLEQALGRSLFVAQGRGLALTEAGRVALGYADQIFLLGEELQQALADAELESTIRLAAGITDVVPKTISSRLLEPALRLETRVRVSCSEGTFDELLTGLALHRLDLVLADRPAAARGPQQFQSHLLARSPVMLFGSPALSARYRSNFPASLARAPLLLPTRDNVLRGQVEQWLESRQLRVEVVGECQDEALLATFGRQGWGLFAAPTFNVDDICRQYDVEPVGSLDGVFEHYYAIAGRRKLQNRAVEAILAAAA